MAHKTMEGAQRRKEGTPLSNFASAGERKKERGASSFFGLEANLPLMLLNQLPTQIEIQPRSADAGGTRIPRANKTPKEMRLLCQVMSFGYISVDLQNSGGRSIVIAYQCLTALDSHLPPIPACMGEFAFPLPILLQDLGDLLLRNGKTRLEQGVRDFPFHLLDRPPIEFCGPLVPGNDVACWIANRDGIVGEMKHGPADADVH